MTANMGTGHDTSIYGLHDVEAGMPAPEELTVHGGPCGGDDIRVIYGFKPLPDPPDFVAMPITVNVDVEGGGNSIGVDYGIDAIPAISSIDSLLVLAIPLTTNVRGYRVGLFSYLGSGLAYERVRHPTA